MALQPIQLDTLDWDQMVGAIRARIVPDSQGKWTLHAPVDPGVTLLELFAWLLDQRIYWMSQVPDALNLAVLALLGVTPLAAQPAVTLLQLADTAVPPRAAPVAAAGTLFQLQDSDPPLIFTLDDAVTVLPLSAGTAVGLVKDSVDRSNDLQQGGLVPLLANGQTAAAVSVVLPLAAPLPAGSPGQFFSLMIDLETPPDAYAQWSTQPAPSVPALTTLTWSYPAAPGGAMTVLPADQVSDGTLGLRRSGVVRLPLPSDWQPEPAAGGVSTTYRLVLNIQNPSLASVAPLRALTTNVVLAHHRWNRVKNPVTSSWLPLPGNVVALAAHASDSNIEEYPPIEDTVQVQVNEPAFGSQPWRRVGDFSLCGPMDRVFTVDRLQSQIGFGNGLNGHLPVINPADVSDVTVSYAAGGGIAGNVGERRPWFAQPGRDSDPFPLFTALNLTAGEGGADSETLELATQRAAAGLNERNRAVTRADYENLVKTTPGVTFRRAYAAVGYDRDFPCTLVPGVVTVFVVPYAPRVQIDGDWAGEVFVAAPQPDPGALQAAQTRLMSGKLLCANATVLGPVYRPVWLGVVIAVTAPLSASLRQQIITGLQEFLDPLVGGGNHDGWPFGDPLRPSALLHVAQDIVGAAGDVQSVSIRTDGMTTPESCRDVTISPHELVNLMHVDLRTQRRSAQSAGLR